jgi:LuxR family quorum-sensing system transcriptional regulator CciR
MGLVPNCPEECRPATGFLDCLRRVQSDSELAALLDQICHELGFRHYAIIDHVDLRRRSPGLVHIDNYPAVWSEHFVRNRIYLDDPVIQASLTTNVGFTWDEVPSMIRLTAVQQEILAGAARNGLREGVTVPANIPGQVHGSCSFAAHPSRSLPRSSLDVAFIIGAFAFAAARRIRRATSTAPPSPRLTPRQRECLVLVANGKTDWEISRILGLSEETVTKYLNAARRRYDVATRAQLVSAALYDGQIGFLDLQRWQ